MVKSRPVPARDGPNRRLELFTQDVTASCSGLLEEIYPTGAERSSLSSSS